VVSVKTSVDIRGHPWTLYAYDGQSDRGISVVGSDPAGRPEDPGGPGSHHGTVA
jgi:hypothetical protein